MDEKVKKHDDAESRELDFHVFCGDLRRGFVKFWWVGVCCALLFGGLQFYTTCIRGKPLYVCSATYTVFTEDVGSVGDNGLPTYTFAYNKSTADQFTAVYSYAVESAVVCQRVCADLGVSEMPANVTAECIGESNLLKITAEGTDPEMTCAVIESAAEHCSAVTDYIIGRTKLGVISAPAILDEAPDRGDGRTAAARGVLLGILLGIVWIVFYAFIRSTVRTGDEIRSKLHTACLGVLPQVTIPKHRPQTHTDLLLSSPYTESGFLEAVRLLCSSVRTSLGESGKTLLITSTAPGEGRSTAAIHLAVMSAQNKRRVLLIDCDVHKGGIYAGLSLEPVLQRDKEVPGILWHADSLSIDILRFDFRKIHPRSVLRETFLRNVINSVREQYDFILVDAPPCGVISDVASAARAVDGVLYIVRQDTVMLSHVRSGIQSIRSLGGNVLGCVLGGAAGGFAGYGSCYSYHGYPR